MGLESLPTFTINGAIILMYGICALKYGSMVPPCSIYHHVLCTSMYGPILDPCFIYHKKIYVGKYTNRPRGSWAGPPRTHGNSMDVFFAAKLNIKNQGTIEQ